MKTIGKAVLLAAAATLAMGSAVGAPAFAQKKKDKEEKAAQPQLSPDVLPLAAEAQKKLQAGDGPGALAQLNQAAPLAKTPDDKFILGSLMIDAGGRIPDLAVQRRGVDMALESGKVPPTEVGKYHFFAGQFASAAGENDKAIEQFTAAQQKGYTDQKLPILLANSYLKAKRPEGVAMLKQAVQAEVTAGRKPDENWLLVGRSEAYRGNQPAEAAWWSRELIKAYPTPKNWRDGLLIYRDSAKLDGQADLDVLRLMRVTKALSGTGDFVEYATVANDRGLPGEVKKVIDEGRASGALTGENATTKELYTLASGKTKADYASLAGDEKASAGAKDGRTANATADAYVGYGEYAKAIPLYQMALTKGGVDANTVNTRLGIAMALSGNKAGAKEAFAKVTGVREGVADYWELYCDQTA